MAIIAAATAVRIAAAQETTAPVGSQPTPQVASDESRESHRALPTPAAESAPGAPAQEQTGPFYLNAYWNRGINYRVVQELRLPGGPTSAAPEARLTGRIGVRFSLDTAGYVEHGDLPDIGTKIDVRRFFFYTTGELRIGYPVLFKIDVGTVHGSFYLDTNYLWLTDLPYIGNFKIGQFDAPMSFELLSGSSAYTFMELAAPVQALAPGLKAGFQLSNTACHERFTWTFGYFSDGQTTDVGDASKSFARAVGRLTFLPYKPDSDSDFLVHVGMSASYVFSSNEQIQYRARPESFLAAYLVDTGKIVAANAIPVGGELAVLRGPLLAQAEYLASIVRDSALDDPVLRGFYASVAWMLTGERRWYDSNWAVVTRVIPAHDLAPFDGRWGGWEIAGRVSHLDLSEGRVDGGKLWALTGGINWYWNRYFRLMFNYGLDFIDGGPNDGRVNVFQARLQLVL